MGRHVFGRREVAASTARAIKDAEIGQTQIPCLGLVDNNCTRSSMVIY